MGLLKFKNAGYLPVLKDAIIKSIERYFSDEITYPWVKKYNDIPNFTLLSNSTMLNSLSNEALVGCLSNPAGIIFFESWLDENFKVRETWNTLTKEVQDTYPSEDFYNCELGMLFRNHPEDDDQIMNELTLRFVPVSIKICERYFYPFLKLQSEKYNISREDLDELIDSLENYLTFTIISHWMYLYCTFNDNQSTVYIVNPGVNEADVKGKIEAPDS